MHRHYRFIFVANVFAKTVFAFGVSARAIGYKDRLARVRDLVNSDDLGIIWAQRPSSGAQSYYRRICKFDPLRADGVDSALVASPLQMDSPVTESKYMEMAAENFLDGPVKDFVAAWVGPGDYPEDARRRLNVLSLEEVLRRTRRQPDPQAWNNWGKRDGVIR